MAQEGERLIDGDRLMDDAIKSLYNKKAPVDPERAEANFWTGFAVEYGETAMREYPNRTQRNPKTEE